jgi:hypothetical protein
VLKRSKDAQKAPVPAEPQAMYIELIQRTAALELCAVLMSRHEGGRRLLEEGGELSVASGRQEDIFKAYIVPGAGNAAKKPLHRMTVSGGTRPYWDVLRGAEDDVARALAMQLHASAYSACVECVVSTQKEPDKIAKVLFEWASLWENSVDDSQPFTLKVETDFALTSESADYLPSQALLSSSLSQDADTHAAPRGGGGSGGARRSGGGVGGDGGSMMASASFLNASQAMVSQSQAESGDDSGVSSATAGEGSNAGNQASDVVTPTGSEGFELDADFELDELNQHPLMATLMRCVGQLHTRDIAGTDPSPAAGGMPWWLSKLHL